jgi:hypothetical protein
VHEVSTRGSLGRGVSIYFNEPIKRLLGQLVLFGVVHEVTHNTGPDALKFLQGSRHGDTNTQGRVL